MKIQTVITEAADMCRSVETTFTTLMVNDESLLPTEPAKRLELYGQALKLGLDAGSIGDKVGIIAGWAWNGIEKEELFLQINVTDPDGTVRPSSLSECMEMMLKDRPRSSRSTLFRSQEAARVYKILVDAGVIFNRSLCQDHLLVLKDLDPRKMAAIYNRVIEETKGDPIKEDFEIAVAHHFGRRHKPKLSSYKRLKVAGSKILKIAVDALARKEYEFVEEAHEDLGSLFNLKRARKKVPQGLEKSDGDLSSSIDQDGATKTTAVLDSQEVPEGSSSSTATLVSSESGNEGTILDGLPTEKAPKEGRGFKVWVNSSNVVHVLFSDKIERKEQLKASWVDGSGQKQEQYSYGRSDGHKDSIWRKRFDDRSEVLPEVARVYDLLQKA